MDAKSLLKRWENCRRTLRLAAEAIPDGREDFRVTPEAMALGTLVLHCVSAEKSIRDHLTVSPGQIDWNTGFDLEHYPTKNDILAVLDRETELTRGYLADLKDADLATTVKMPWGEPSVGNLWLNWIGHELHHRGALTLTLRVAGVTRRTSGAKLVRQLAGRRGCQCRGPRGVRCFSRPFRGSARG